MLLLISGAGKDCRDLLRAVPGLVPGRPRTSVFLIKLIIEKCHNLLLFQQLEQIELVLFRI